MKQRIMSRSEIARVMLRRRDRHRNYSVQQRDDFMNSDEAEREGQAMEDMMFYMLADGDSVKIYNDVNMGGTVVEIKD